MLPEVQCYMQCSAFRLFPEDCEATHCIYLYYDKRESRLLIRYTSFESFLSSSDRTTRTLHRPMLRWSLCEKDSKSSSEVQWIQKLGWGIWSESDDRCKSVPWTERLWSLYASSSADHSNSWWASRWCCEHRSHIAMEAQALNFTSF